MLTRFSLTLLTLLAATSALAQQSFSAEHLRPASDRSGVLGVESGTVAGHLDYDVALWLGYAHRPFRIARLNLVTGEVTDGEDIIAGRFGLNLVGQLALFDWVQLGVDLPVAAQFAGPGRDDDRLAVPAEGGLGDLRLIPKVRLLREKDMGVDLALVFGATLPTAAPGGGYLGEGAFTFVPELAATKRLGPLRATGSAGLRLRQAVPVLTTRQESEVTFGLGAAYRLHELLDVPVEINAAFTGAQELGSGNRGELAAGVTWDATPALQVFAAAGGGGWGLGTPVFRAFGGVRWAPRVDPDPDGDGVLGDADGCPARAEDKDGFQDEDGCPDEDNDGDGIPDARDQCRDEAEDKDGFKDDDGCVDPDNDGDGVLDGDDRCPGEAGPPENQGCPLRDQDGDGINDPEDKCPAEKGLAEHQGCPDPDPDKDGVLGAEDRCPAEPGAPENKGCPDADEDGVVDPDDRCPNQPGPGTEDGCPEEDVNVTRESIEIPDKVYFDRDKSSLNRAGFAILKKVAKVLEEYTYIKKVRIEAHTDLWGTKKYNEKLSKKRGETVLRFLVKLGVAKERLETVHHGMDKPAVQGMDAEASRKNRRVEFAIVEQDLKATP